MKTSEKKPYALTAGLCYVIYGLYSIISRIIYVQNSKYDSIAAPDVIGWIVMIGMAVALILKNEKAVIAAAGVNAFLNLFSLVSFFGHLFSGWYVMNRVILILFDFIVYLVIIILLLLAPKEKAVAQRLWFVPGTVKLVGCLAEWINFDYSSFLSETWMSILFSLVEIGGLILLGLWVKEHDFILSEAANEYSTFDPQTVYSAPQSDTVIGGADKLKMYKELLDSGTLTQEEFDAKKKEILGL